MPAGEQGIRKPPQRFRITKRRPRRRIQTNITALIAELSGMSQTRGLALTKTNAEYLSHMKPVSVFSGSKDGRAILETLISRHGGLS